MVNLTNLVILFTLLALATLTSQCEMKSQANLRSEKTQTEICPRCQLPVDFTKKVNSLGKFWHKPCLSCAVCGKTLTLGGHAEHDGYPICHTPCYGSILRRCLLFKGQAFVDCVKLTRGPFHQGEHAFESS